MTHRQETVKGEWLMTEKIHKKSAFRKEDVISIWTTWRQTNQVLFSHDLTWISETRWRTGVSFSKVNQTLVLLEEIYLNVYTVYIQISLGTIQLLQNETGTTYKSTCFIVSRRMDRPRVIQVSWWLRFGNVYEKEWIQPTKIITLILWVVPPPSNSHHQDYYIFSRESL